MANIYVGAGESYTRIADAIAASRDGDTLYVKAGTYQNEFATIDKKISIVGVGGMVHIEATVPPPNSKGIFVVRNDVTFDHIEFSGVRGAPGKNGAGIRYEAGIMVVRNSYFHDNEEGILAAANSAGTITIDRSEFARNGYGDGQSHGIYINAVGRLTVTNSYFHDQVTGHHIKSRALESVITNNRMDDGNGDSAYSIDLPNGGAATVTNNVMVQGVNGGNPTLLAYGAEGNLHANSRMTAEGNTFINYKASSTGVTNFTSTVTVDLANNAFYNVARVVNGAANQSGTTTLSSAPQVSTASPWDDFATAPSTPTTPTTPTTPSEPTPTTPTTPAPTEPTPATPTGPRVISGTDGNREATLGGGGETVRVTGMERLTGGAGADDVTVDDDRCMLSVSGVERLTAAGSANWINLGDGGNDIRLTGAETLIGGAGFDHVRLGGGRTMMAAVESLTGSDGGDWVDLGNRGNAVTMSGVETLIGGAGIDAVTLGNGANHVVLAAIETLNGGAGGDWIDLGNRGGTLTLNGVETLVGGTGVDAVTLGNGGNRVVLAAVEALGCGTGADWIELGNRGNNMWLTGAETLIGGVGSDVVTLGDWGNTMIVAAVETIYGGAGTDALTLGNRGGTLSVANVEAVAGGRNADAVTVLAGAISFSGGGGDDSLALAANGAVDRVIFASAEDGTDTVTGFEAGADRIVLAGALRAQVDDDGNDGLAAATRGRNGVNASTDELAVLSEQIAAFDAGYASFRTALGSLAGSSAGADMLVVARTGSETGLFLVTDANGDGSVAAEEVRLLARVGGTTLAATDVGVG